MEEIIHAFGIDWRLIVIQMFNFAILAGALWYFLYTPVLKLLNERKEVIKKGVDDAVAAANARTSAETERAAVLTEAEREARSVVGNAQKQAEEKTMHLEEEAKGKAALILKEAAAEAEEVAKKSRRESEAEIARVAILAAEKILSSGQAK